MMDSKSIRNGRLRASIQRHGTVQTLTQLRDHHVAFQSALTEVGVRQVLDFKGRRYFEVGGPRNSPGSPFSESRTLWECTFLLFFNTVITLKLKLQMKLCSCPLESLESMYCLKKCPGVHSTLDK